MTPILLIGSLIALGLLALLIKIVRVLRQDGDSWRDILGNLTFAAVLILLAVIAYLLLNASGSYGPAL